LGRKVRRAIKGSRVEVGEERVVAVSKKEGSNVQFVKMSVNGDKMFVGGSIDACYEYSLSNKEERVINKFDFWSIHVTQGFVYIGGFKEVCVYDVSLGRFTKSIKTKDFVYCIFQLDSDHFLCGSCKGHLEIINSKYQEVLSESKISGTVFDIC
jgi:alpha-D-ribose 1-methylphosphonate 5-phosphate C-P lyase